MSLLYSSRQNEMATTLTTDSVSKQVAALLKRMGASSSDEMHVAAQMLTAAVSAVANLPGIVVPVAEAAALDAPEAEAEAAATAVPVPAAGHRKRAAANMSSSPGVAPAVSSEAAPVPALALAEEAGAAVAAVAAAALVQPTLKKAKAARKAAVPAEGVTVVPAAAAVDEASEVEGTASLLKKYSKLGEACLNLGLPVPAPDPRDKKSSAQAVTLRAHATRCLLAVEAPNKPVGAKTDTILSFLRSAGKAAKLGRDTAGAGAGAEMAEEAAAAEEEATEGEGSVAGSDSEEAEAAVDAVTA